MKPTLSILFLFTCTITNAQQEPTPAFKKILTGILQDSSFTRDISTINGIPATLTYQLKNKETDQIVLNTKYQTKQYIRENAVSPAITVTGFRYRKNQSHETARFILHFSDGTTARVHARCLSKNLGWYPAFYILNGRNLETRGKVVIIKGEI